MKQNYLDAISSENDARSALAAIENAAIAQGALLSSSALLSGGAAALGGVPMIGFTGLGTSSSVVGSATATIEIPITSMGLTKTVATGTAASYGNTAFTASLISQSLFVGRYLERYLDPRLRNQAQASLQQLENARLAANIALKAQQLAHEEIQKQCSCYK